MWVRKLDKPIDYSKIESDSLVVHHCDLCKKIALANIDLYQLVAKSNHITRTEAKERCLYMCYGTSNINWCDIVDKKILEEML